MASARSSNSKISAAGTHIVFDEENAPDKLEDNERESLDLKQLSLADLRELVYKLQDDMKHLLKSNMYPDELKGENAE